MPSIRTSDSASGNTLNSPQVEIPRGVADYFWTEAFARRQLEMGLLRLFRTWGYEDVIPPMFEYADTYQGRSNHELQTEIYRFLDRDGSTLALRPDMTIAVARLAGVRLHDRPMPQRYCYAGSVFRYTEVQAGRQREFFQAGCELIGAASAMADAEILALTVRALAAAGLRDFRLVLGQIQYFHGLLQDLQLDFTQTAALRQAIDRNSEAQLADFLRSTPLRAEQRRTVEQLPQLSGPDAKTIIAQADRLCLNRTMAAALENLRDIHEMLDAHGVADAVYLDLTEINNLGYYTGITFEILTHELGFPVGSGGRYDNLLGTFGTHQPAVGVALGLDRLLLARTIQDQTVRSSQPITPDLLVAASTDAVCLQMVETWREAGLRVIMSLQRADNSELRRAAQQIGARYFVTWTAEGIQLTRTADPDALPCTLDADAAGHLIDSLMTGAPLPVAVP